MSDLLDRILPYSMWREKGNRSPGRWKVTSRHYTETSEGVLECVRLTHFAGLRGNRDHKSRYMTAQSFLANFVYILPEERYRRLIPGLSVKESDLQIDEHEATKALFDQFRRCFPEMAAEGDRNRYVAELEGRIAELENAERSREILERKLK